MQLQRWLGPLPGQREARAFSWISLTVALIICLVALVRGFQRETFLGRPLGGDFVQFYVAGKVLNQYDPARLYDLELEVRLQHEALPEMPASQMLVFASAPAVAAFYRPFAMLPYRWAYVAWLLFSFLLYAGAMALLVRSVALSKDHRRTGFLLGLSAMPFVLETWIGGQISVLAFAAIAIFVFLRSRNLPMLAGCALAMAAFKPTLVVIPILMLLIGRRWRLLSGVVAGGAAMSLASFFVAGSAGCAAWVQTLRFYGRIAGGTGSALHRNKYVDVGSFFHLIFGDPSSVAQGLAGLAAMAGLGLLGYAWWRSTKWNPEAEDLLWSATFAGALVLNVYTPIYDTSLLAIPVALCGAWALGRKGSARETFGGWILLLYMVPWLTQAIAEFLRIQPFTVALAGFAGWVLQQAWRERAASGSLQDFDIAVDGAATLAAGERSAYTGALGSGTVAQFNRTSNSGMRLGDSLRSYSSMPTLIWERDR